ncbi:uncharacterized protein PITG_10854 [Phytophthora infestans T30-4]|uniref:Uncharacterized protein n=1 Tax=Phytophthora infestans (strain T30-4) TaxID=403677 RepID=D0NH86_PHYIT|nr:uncharacterized protein PITG_10854 [Phytophthora infestans T30-4]EEY58725.1 hypothetical protein PITG_10854 [Phytophthora infestans T30-4]|eukprot:XP_002901669.1 hypothetical protein PITG_10854 [Phytophthora infestans T30-4]
MIAVTVSSESILCSSQAAVTPIYIAAMDSKSVVAIVEAMCRDLLDITGTARTIMHYWNLNALSDAVRAPIAA